MRDALGNVGPLGNFLVKQPDVVEQLVDLLLGVRFTQLVTPMGFRLQLTGSMAHPFAQTDEGNQKNHGTGQRFGSTTGPHAPAASLSMAWAWSTDALAGQLEWILRA